MATNDKPDDAVIESVLELFDNADTERQRILFEATARRALLWKQLANAYAEVVACYRQERRVSGKIRRRIADLGSKLGEEG
jgi:hypothetical protein